jgi:hypothetical protein
MLSKKAGAVGNSWIVCRHMQFLRDFPRYSLGPDHSGLDGFVQGLFGEAKAIDLPERAHRGKANSPNCE